MSGGSYDYKSYVLEEYYVGKMYDTELDEMLKDLIEVLHDIEWWQSCDISEEDYRETVNKFKKKWFKRDTFQVKNFIEEQFNNIKQELLKQFNYLEDK